jgi:hypothetical protein
MDLAFRRIDTTGSVRNASGRKTWRSGALRQTQDAKRKLVRSFIIPGTSPQGGKNEQLIRPDRQKMTPTEETR